MNLEPMEISMTLMQPRFPFSLRAALLAVAALVATIAGLALAGDAAAAKAGPRSLDAMLTEVARELPGFGGAFLGDDGKLHVYLADMEQRPRARAELREVFGGKATRGAIIVHKAQFGFLKLKGWHDAHRPVTLGIDGVVSVDISESTNRLRIGVSSETARGRVEEALAALGIPLAAAEIVDDEPTVISVDLTDTQRPLIGGIQIEMALGDCSLGFIAVRKGVPGFVTVAHCTKKYGGVDGTEFFQSVTDADGLNLVGFESVDPRRLPTSSARSRGGGSTYP
jgi:hypothetical protein